jgi:hypothetical protein
MGALHHVAGTVASGISLRLPDRLGHGVELIDTQGEQDVTDSCPV